MSESELFTVRNVAGAVTYTPNAPGSGVRASNEARGSTYPNSPGFKREGTSKLAAETFASEDDKLRDQVMKVLSLGDYTSDEIAVRLKRTPFSIRPRVSQLFTQGKIADTGQRRKNESGHQATVWRIRENL